MSLKKVWDTLFSYKGMRAVNILFILALLLPDRGLIFAAHLLWIAYLTVGLKVSPSRAVRAVYLLFLLFASAMVLANGYFLLR